MIRRILVVDDDSRWRQTLKNVLKDMEYNVCTASSLSEAQQFLDSFQFGLALVDIDLDGLGFAGQGGQLFYMLCERFPSTRVIAITATSVNSRHMRDLFVSCGIRDFVHKDDFNVKRFRELIQTLESTLRTRQPDTSKQAKPSEVERKDFFLSYNKADRQWAEWIAWQLEEASYTTVIQAWDFRPGGNFVIDMQRAAEQALRTIAVLSPDYLEALYTQSEWAAAFAQDPTGEKGTLLPVRVRECELKGLLSQIVYIDLVGLAEEAARETLLAGLKPGRAKPITEPGFPAVTPAQATSRQPDFPGGHAKHQTPPKLSEDKLEFLCWVYLKANGRVLGSTVNSEDIANELGLTQLRTIEVAQYLDRKGLVNFETWDIGIKITHQGVVKVESDLFESTLLSEYISPEEVKKIGERKRDRFQFLCHLNEKTEGDTFKKILILEMASDLGLDYDQVLTDIIPYLDEGDWIKIRTNDSIAITEEGVEHLLRDLKAES
jgi:DNA-binding response OmpR family regulator